MWEGGGMRFLNNVKNRFLVFLIYNHQRIPSLLITMYKNDTRFKSMFWPHFDDNEFYKSCTKSFHLVEKASQI